MGSKFKNRSHRTMPSPRMPYNVQNKSLRESNQELKRVLNKVQRLLWIAVSQSKGRIEITEADYRMAIQMPDIDCILSTEYDAKEKMVAIVFTDKKGERLPGSDKPLVILTDG